MDPATIAAAAVAAIGPYLAKAAGKFAESAGEAALEQGGKLFAKLKAHFAASPAQAEDLRDLQAEPQKLANQGSVEKHLLRALQQDPAFLQEIVELLGPAAAAGQRNTFSTQATTIGNVTNAGSVQTLYVGAKPDSP